MTIEFEIILPAESDFLAELKRRNSTPIAKSKPTQPIISRDLHQDRERSKVLRAIYQDNELQELLEKLRYLGIDSSGFERHVVTIVDNAFEKNDPSLLRKINWKLLEFLIRRYESKLEKIERQERQAYKRLERKLAGRRARLKRRIERAQKAKDVELLKTLGRKLVKLDEFVKRLELAKVGNVAGPLTQWAGDALFVSQWLTTQAARASLEAALEIASSLMKKKPG